MVEVANPDEDDMEMPGRHIISTQNNSNEPDYYGSIEEK